MAHLSDIYRIYHEWSTNYVTRSSLSLLFDFENPPHGMVGRMTFSSFSLIIFTVHYPFDRKVNPLPLSLSLSLSLSLKFLHA